MTILCESGSLALLVFTFWGKLEPSNKPGKRTGIGPFPPFCPLPQVSLFVLFDTLLLITIESALLWFCVGEFSMELHDVEPKLVTLLHADVKGYSRLIGKDTVRTLGYLNSSF